MAICLHCMRKVNYNVIVTPVKVYINGLEVTYKEEVAHCCNCNRELYVPKINDNNVRHRSRAYFNALRGV